MGEMGGTSSQSKRYIVAEPSLLGVESGTDGRTCGKRASLQGLAVSTFTGSPPMRKPEKIGEAVRSEILYVEADVLL